MNRNHPHDRAPSFLGALMTRDGSSTLPGASKRTAEQVDTRLAELRERSDMRRMAEVGSVNIEARTAEIAFSSEAEVRRWFGVEVLDHSPGAMVMDRLATGAALLWNHDWDEQIGVVESARIDQDRKGRATVRFSRSEDGEEKLQDVADKIVRHVSVGYRVLDARLQEVRDDDTEVWLITRWEPYEISLVSVPADISVGVGRKLENPQEEKPSNAAENAQHRNSQTRTEPQPKGNTTMNIKVLRNAAGHLVRAEVDEAGNIVKELEVLERAGEDVQAHLRSGTNAERTRVRTLQEMGDKYSKAVPNAGELARKAIADGDTPEQLQARLLEAVNQRAARPLSEQTEEAAIGMSDSDVRCFSLLRAIRALAPNATAKDREAAAFEFECSAAAQRAYDREAKGILIPAEVLARAFNAGGAANTPSGAQSGANLVANTLLTGSFIEMLRNRTTIMRLGTTLGGLVGTVDIPKQTGGATAYWVGEGEDATEGTPVIGQLAMAPKTVAAYTDLTRRLMMQSTPDAEGIVRRDLANALAQALDYAGYYGSGSDKQPRGIKNYSGINAVDFAASGDGGTSAAPTFAELVKMETEVAADNADIGQMGYVGHSRFRGYCKTTPKFGSGTESTIWEPGGTVNGYRTEITNQVLATDVFFGNFADFIIAMWGGLDLTVDPYSLSKSGGLRIVMFQDVDMNLRRVESVCWGSHLVS